MFVARYTHGCDADLSPATASARSSSPRHQGRIQAHAVSHCPPPVQNSRLRHWPLNPRYTTRNTCTAGHAGGQVQWRYVAVDSTGRVRPSEEKGRNVSSRWLFTTEKIQGEEPCNAL